MLDMKYILATFPCIMVVASWVAALYGVWALHLWSDFRSDIRMLPLIVAIPFLSLAITIDHGINLINYLISGYDFAVAPEYVLGKVATKLAYTTGLLLMLYTYWKVRLNLCGWHLPRCMITWIGIMAGTYYGSFKLLCWLQGVIK